MFLLEKKRIRSESVLGKKPWRAHLGAAAALVFGAAMLIPDPAPAVDPVPAHRLPAGAIVTRPMDIKWEECWGAPPGGKCAVVAGRTHQDWLVRASDQSAG